MNWLKNLIYRKPKYVIDRGNCKCRECVKYRRDKAMKEETETLVEQIFKKHGL